MDVEVGGQAPSRRTPRKTEHVRPHADTASESERAPRPGHAGCSPAELPRPGCSAEEPLPGQGTVLSLEGKRPPSAVSSALLGPLYSHRLQRGRRATTTSPDPGSSTPSTRPGTPTTCSTATYHSLSSEPVPRIARRSPVPRSPSSWSRLNGSSASGWLGFSARTKASMSSASPTASPSCSSSVPPRPPTLS